MGKGIVRERSWHSGGDGCFEIGPVVQRGSIGNREAGIGVWSDGEGAGASGVGELED